MPQRRDYILIGGLALLVVILLASAIRQPGYTDAYYYFNAGQRLAEGDGLTDPYLWTYINAPDHLPGPSHTYWMPLQSLVAAASMFFGGATFGAAQVPSVLCLVGLVLLTFWLGGYLGHTRRHAWVAGLLVLFSGFFTPFWTTTDTFALYGLVGAGALIAIGLGRALKNWRWYALGGAFCALAHLTRADGILLLVVLLVVAFWPPFNWRSSITAAAVGLAAYLVVMLPWFVRNTAEIGTPLPLGGAQAIWLRGYDELVNYPPGANASDFLKWGLDHILQSRWEALKNNFGTFVAVETWIVLSPFVLIGLWKRRNMPFLLGVILYALGLHFVMTFIFAYPGYRGGLFHSSSALLPFWAILGVLGLDDAINWMVKRRRWEKAQAQMVFNSALIVLAVVLSLSMFLRRSTDWNDTGTFYETLATDLTPDAVLMINDPAALYYHTQLAGVVIPNAEPDVVPEIAAQYGVTHLVLDVNRTQPFSSLFWGEETRPFLRLYRLYDQGTSDLADDVRVFEITAGENGE